MKTMKTIKMKKVLIALDYDTTAQKVAEVGYSLANTMGAEVTLLHVISEPIYYTSPGHTTIMGFSNAEDINAIQMDSVDGLKKASQNFLDKSKRYLGDNSIQTIVKEGNYADTILSTANKLHADLIVMGSHSRKWFENIVMGSVTKEVLYHTSIPLFIIPIKQKK